MAQVNSYVKITGSGQVVTGEGVLSGYYANYGHNSVITLYDWTSASGEIVEMNYPGTGYNDLGEIRFTNGLYVVGGTSTAVLDVTFLIKQSD